MKGEREGERERGREEEREGGREGVRKGMEGRRSELERELEAVNEEEILIRKATETARRRKRKRDEERDVWREEGKQNNSFCFCKFYSNHTVPKFTSELDKLENQSITGGFKLLSSKMATRAKVR